MLVNTNSYVEVSVPAESLRADNHSNDGGAILSLSPRDAKELAGRLNDAVKELERKRK